MKIKKRNSFRSTPLMGKKAKLVWTKDLHKKFVEAVEKLGVHKAVPRKIVELMKVDGLTRDHISSHLQKHRLVEKSISNKGSCNQAASKQSSMNDGASLNNSSSMLNQEQNNLPSTNTMQAINPPILDTSSNYFSVLEAPNFNVTTSSELAPSSSLIPYEGCSVQAMTNNHDQQRNIMNDSTDHLGVENCLNYSSDFEFVDDFIYDYGSCSSEEQIYNNSEIGSSSGVQHSSDSSILQNNPNGFESNFSSQSGFIEMNSLYNTNLNSNLENVMGENDLILNEADIASLLSYVDDHVEHGGNSDNLPVTLDLQNQDVNGDNFHNIAALDSNQNELTSFNEHQTADGYLLSFDPNFNMNYNISEHMEPIWIPDPFEDELTLEDLNFNSYLED